MISACQMAKDTAFVAYANDRHCVFYLKKL